MPVRLVVAGGALCVVVGGREGGVSVVLGDGEEDEDEEEGCDEDVDRD